MSEPRRPRVHRAVVLALAASALPSSASAFCGFYVTGAEASLTNQATLVVLMREGNRTALSMQNDYQGPPEDFALVVPVPIVLSEDNVRTLPPRLFAKVDRLSAPRLVEYWEMDPCRAELPETAAMPGSRRRLLAAPERSAGAAELGVTIEAQFEVGEYDIVILSAEDSSGLETWLRQEAYRIPEGASAALRPYVEQGTKFFVAKVDVERVTFRDGRAVLSPLRVHYDEERFALPVRLGLLNSSGTQDLVVHILARGQRYDVANYESVTIPTNLDVADEVRTRFGEFYAGLFDRTLARNPGAVVTEYAWQSSSCDPCPGPTLGPQDLMTLGADVMPGLGPPDPLAPRVGALTGFVLTRLHYRYGEGALDEDLVFRAAPPIAGGREVRTNGDLEHGATSASFNNFQARYAIRHPWEGEIACRDPVRGRWGGPPRGVTRPEVKPAQDLAFARRGELALAGVLRTDAPEIEVEAGLPSIATLLTGTAEAQEPSDGEGRRGAPGEEGAAGGAPQDDGGACGACAIGSRRRPAQAGGGLLLAGLLLAWRRRRRSVAA
ncbi:MAG: DUF2330 domain-containing protein [Sandaracinaceae bacterium]